MSVNIESIGCQAPLPEGIRLTTAITRVFTVLGMLAAIAAHGQSCPTGSTNCTQFNTINVTAFYSGLTYCDTYPSAPPCQDIQPNWDTGQAWGGGAPGDTPQQTCATFLATIPQPPGCTPTTLILEPTSPSFWTGCDFHSPSTMPTLFDRESEFNEACTVWHGCPWFTSDQATCENLVSSYATNECALGYFNNPTGRADCLADANAFKGTLKSNPSSLNLNPFDSERKKAECSLWQKEYAVACP